MEAARTSVGKVAATTAPRQTQQPDRATEDDFRKELNKQRAIVRSAQARTPAPTPSTTAGAPSALKMVPTGPTGPAADPAAGAQRVLDTGRRALLVDNYEARMEAFAGELQKGDAPYRLRLMQEVLKRDPRALGSWLTPERANTLHAQGHVTTEQRAAMAESLASAFNHGVLKLNTLDAGQRPGRADHGQVAFSELDNAIWGYGPPGSGNDRLENAQKARNVLDFFGSSSGPEVQAFRTNYGRHLIDQYVLNDAVGYHNAERRDAAAGLAANLLAGDTRHPDIATDVLGSYDFAQIKTIMESAARSNDLYAADALRPYAQSRNVDARDSGLPNGSALLMDAVALSRSAKADAVAASLARLPANAPSIFDKRHYGGKDNVDALTLVVANHADAVLDSRTRYDQTYIGDADNPNLQQYMVNGAELGALFSTTLFNPDSTYRDTLQDAVTRYAGQLERTVNQPGPNREAAGRLAMLSASLTDAVRQDNMGLAKNEAARKQLLGMAVDIALAALPVGKWASSAAEKLIAQAFTGQRVQDALKGLSGTLIDTATGQLTDKAKAQIVDALGKDNGNAEIAKNLANSLHDGIFNQISEADYDKEFMQNAYTGILSGIQLSRLPGT